MGGGSKEGGGEGREGEKSSQCVSLSTGHLISPPASLFWRPCENRGRTVFHKSVWFTRNVYMQMGERAPDIMAKSRLDEKNVLTLLLCHPADSTT